jgi:hypothetical protein
MAANSVANSETSLSPAAFNTPDAKAASIPLIMSKKLLPKPLQMKLKNKRLD